MGKTLLLTLLGTPPASLGAFLKKQWQGLSLDLLPLEGGARASPHTRLQPSGLVGWAALGWSGVCGGRGQGGWLPPPLRMCL